MDCKGCSRREFLDRLTRWGITAGGAGLVAASPTLQNLMGLTPEQVFAAESLRDLIRRSPKARRGDHAGAKATTAGSWHIGGQEPQGSCMWTIQNSRHFLCAGIQKLKYNKPQ